MLDDDLAVKLRVLQSQLIHKTKGPVTFSQVMNDTIRTGIKIGKKK